MPRDDEGKEQTKGRSGADSSGPLWAGPLVGAVLGAIWWHWVQSIEIGVPRVLFGTIAAWAALAALWSLPIPRLRALRQELRELLQQLPRSGPRPSAIACVVQVVSALPILALLTVPVTPITSHPLSLGIIGGLLLILALSAVVADRTRRAINELASSGAAPRSVTAAPPVALAPPQELTPHARGPSSRRAGLPPTPPSGNEPRIQLLHLGDLTGTGASGRDRVRAVRQRGVELRRLHLRAILTLVGIWLSLAGLQVLGALLGSDMERRQQSAGVLLGIVVVAGMSGISVLVFRRGRAGTLWIVDNFWMRPLLNRGARILKWTTSAPERGGTLTALIDKFKGAKAENGTGDSAPAADDLDLVEPIRENVLPILERKWRLGGLVLAPLLAATGGPSAWLTAPAAIVAVVRQTTWIRRKRRELEKRTPFAPALNLLLLRVFGSPSFDHFLARTALWRWLGTRQWLDGPDTSGRQLSQVLRFMSGRVDLSVVEDERELHTAVQRMRSQPNWQLMFPTHSMQCNAATWKDAVNHMLANADAVALDLSMFSEANQGAIYELRLVLREIPWRRLLILVSDDTDMAFFERAIAEAQLASESESGNVSEARVRVLHFDPTTSLAQRGGEQEDPQESLAALLFEMASPPRNAATADAVPDEFANHWTRLLPLPEGLHRAMRAAVWIATAVSTFATALILIL